MTATTAGYIALAVWAGSAVLNIVWAQMEIDNAGRDLTTIDLLRTLFLAIALAPLNLLWRLGSLARR